MPRFFPCACSGRLAAVSPERRLRKQASAKDEVGVGGGEIRADASPGAGLRFGEEEVVVKQGSGGDDRSAWSTRSTTSVCESHITFSPSGADVHEPLAHRFRCTAIFVRAAIRIQRQTGRGTAAMSAEEAEVSAKVRQLMSMREAGGSLMGLSDFAKAYGDEAFCRRILRKYDGDVRRASDGYAKALRWRERNEELLTTRQYALASDLRCLGADLEQRPVLYMCTNNQMRSSAQGLDQMMVMMLEAVDSMPKGVEKMTHIWDLEGWSLRYNYNPAPVLQLMQVVESYFAERLRQMIIIDMPRAAVFLKDACWPLVSEKTRQKIKFMSAQEAKRHFCGQLAPESAARVCDAIDQNRDTRLSPAQRRATWRHVNRAGQVVPFGA